jgi:hypothetical protein
LYGLFATGLVDGLNYLGVDDVAFFKRLVQFQFADHATQRRLSQLGNGNDVVGRAVAGAHRVRDLKVQDAIHLQLRVIPGDTYLAGHIQWHFLEAVFVGHPVNKWDQEVQARCKRGVVLAQTLHHPGILLRHHLDGARDEDDGNNKYDESDFHVWPLLNLEFVDEKAIAHEFRNPVRAR